MQQWRGSEIELEQMKESQQNYAKVILDKVVSERAR